MKQGTEWTEPGQGSNLKDLWFSVARLTSKAAIRAQQRIVDITPINAGYYGVLSCYPTNLRLTGEPLTAEDLERIAKCK